MHSGRSHHTAKDIALSIVGGFAASLLTFTVTLQKSPSFRGQIIAGERGIDSDYPTTLGQMQGVMNGNNEIIAGFTSLGFWSLVIIGGFIASLVLFKWMRRYV